MAALADALNRGDAAAAAGLFEPGGYWRDFLALTWNLTTCEGREQIRAMLAATLATARPGAWALQGPAKQADGTIEAWFGFETAAGRGTGILRLRDGRCWTLLTTLQSLKGFEERCGRNGNREPGVVHGVTRDRQSWLERREAVAAELGRTRQPFCLIVGGGQGGLALAARLGRLNVPALVIDAHARAGDAWRKRYRSLALHDPVWYDHLPYLPFPDHWPVFSPKDKIGDWLEMYARVMEINLWSSTTCLGARRDEANDRWDVEVERDGERIMLRPRHLVLATGLSGLPNMPALPGAEGFEGTLCHSGDHAGGEAYRGKKCVVLGANNSAHDICADLWEHGAEPVMLQRSPTVVVRSEMLMEFAWGRLYSEEAVRAGITTERADLLNASVPLRVMPQLQQPIYEEIRRRDAALYEGLDRAGFLYHFGEDGSGIHSTYMRRGAGYYIDVGATPMVIDGRIGLRRAGIARLERRAVHLDDGSVLPADLVVCATGYGPMNQWVEKLVSPEVAEKVGRCWGVGSDTKGDPGPWEGEPRNMWKPTRQPGLWFQAGNLMQARHYSIYLALQLKARMEGLATPVYGLAPAHHRH
ncbi:MAG TPA: NAD(P)/FAD-dependent oxidoreductase [Burkholderiales bacterium]